MLARTQVVDADPLALQVADGANRVVCEQLEAAGVHARERGKRHAGVEPEDDRSRVREHEIELSVREHLRHCEA
jgi:hypothetical protein